ncbi:MAG: M20/M25/M40 family metallo-hydrolase, partial [Candidatus Heimdallarchaeota archaeon]|nr:M20/M25/M40 family metallo-hydrolase [Candidatus Heimdallarchaeota archaeon]
MEDTIVDVIELLKKLVSYDTRTNHSQPGKDVKVLLENEIEPRLKEFGFDVEYIEVKGHYSILAKRKRSSPSILFSGHLDVVPWDDRWVTDPQTVVELQENGKNVLKGRGVSDMKSGVASLVVALPEIAKSDATIYFALTGDEEIGGEDGTGSIVEKLRDRDELPDYVITADTAGMEIITKRRNIFDLTLSAKK